MDQRKRKFAAADRRQAVAWQESSRKRLFGLLKLADLVEAERAGRGGRPGIPLKPAVVATKRLGRYTRHDLRILSTPTRRIDARMTVPSPPAGGKRPAVVCIHGHGDSRSKVYDRGSIYRGFARSLAERGYVTIAADVGQHEVYEKSRTLVGERLWDLMRCVSYLTTRPEVDAERIGCAGLSLGGEMAMWLGAMDTRVKATVSSGFLTTGANMRREHCPCWEFPGLTESFDFADLYSLIAPRHLCCQNGRKERAPEGFPVPIARGAFAEIQACYKVFGEPGRAVRAVHPAGHVFDVPSAVAFLDKALRPEPAPR